MVILKWDFLETTLQQVNLSNEPSFLKVYVLETLTGKFHMFMEFHCYY